METSRFWKMPRARGAVVVAHPDDETLWAGGMLLTRPDWQWTVVSLCRGSDRDRAPRFHRVLDRYGAVGNMGDLDDGPDQLPMPPAAVEAAVLALLPEPSFDVIVTHSPFGEYTRHRRHEEASDAVVSLWEAGALSAGELWMFAYEDDDRRHLPVAMSRAPLGGPLEPSVWLAKKRIVEDLYGFAADSWEARTTPRGEAFWMFKNAADYHSWRAEEEKML